MISLKELNPHELPTTPTIDANLLVLLERINKIRDAWGKPMIVTSGLRSQELQDQLYRMKISNTMASHHLTGCAVDILDVSGALYIWTKANTALLESVGLWCEERGGHWQHFQILPPKSGKRWFYP